MNNAGMSGKRYKHSNPREAVMEIFDNLPPRLRRSLREAPYAFSPVQIAEELRKGRSVLKLEIILERRSAQLARAEREVLGHTL